MSVCDIRNGINHIQAHFYTAVGMVRLGLGQSWHAVVTVPQYLYAPAVILLQTQREKERWAMSVRLETFSYFECILHISLNVSLSGLMSLNESLIVWWHIMINVAAFLQLCTLERYEGDRDRGFIDPFPAWGESKIPAEEHRKQLFYT